MAPQEPLDQQVPPELPDAKVKKVNRQTVVKRSGDRQEEMGRKVNADLQDGQDEKENQLWRREHKKKDKRESPDRKDLPVTKDRPGLMEQQDQADFQGLRALQVGQGSLEMLVSMG